MKKKLITIATVALMLAGCNSQFATRNFGGKSEITLKKGQRLVEMTWKENDLWILTEPMDSNYVPQIKTFYESSLFGAWEGEITIIETR